MHNVEFLIKFKQCSKMFVQMELITTGLYYGIMVYVRLYYCRGYPKFPEKLYLVHYDNLKRNTKGSS